ncbi:HemK2/MTQ2 family protein methyltransferase [candidate division KSB1 bacterium]
MLYKPREDSYLLAKHVKKHAFGNVLDMGTGSGIQAITAAKLKKVKLVLAVDVQKSVVEYCKKTTKSKKISFKQSNLFENISDKPGFDTIIFNPPYLPEDVRLKDITVDGGKKGYELLERFLNDISAFLKPDGMLLLLFSSLTKKDKVHEFIANNLLEFKELEKQKLFFEYLYVYKIKKSSLLKMLEKKKIAGIKKFMKGHRGLIFTGKIGKKGRTKKIAIKMQRKDIGVTGTVDREAKVLKILNKNKIGPKILFAGTDFFVYEFIEGVFIPEFLERSSKKQIIAVIKDVFQQCYKLDRLGINKEEMHHPYKHVVVSKKGKSVLLDFERAKNTINPHNVTQFCQYVSSVKVRNLTKGKLKIDGNKLRKLAAIYKKDQTKKNYDNILKTIIA